MPGFPPGSLVIPATSSRSFDAAGCAVARPLPLRLICGDTREAAALLKPNSVHLMVTDAPYGVQKGTAGRQDSIGGTIAAALPGWHSVLKPGGVLAISFNTHVTKRDALIRLMEKAGFEAVQTANLEHWVEQAISRDVILARKP